MTRGRVALAACALAAAALGALLWRGGARSGASAGEDAEAIAQLQALGYAEWSPVASGPAQRGVVRHDPARSAPGFNLYGSRDDRRAVLVDMAGAQVHEWSSQRESADWNHVEPVGAGDLLVLDRADAVERLDWSSRSLWRTALAPHHDLDVDAEGRIHALVARARFVPWRQRDDLPVVTEVVVTLSAAGEPLREVDLWPLLGQRVSEERLAKIDAAARGLRHWWNSLRGKPALDDGVSDIFHANSIEVLDRDVPGLGRRGNALVSVRNLDLVAVFDLAEPALVWSFGPGVIDDQHHASLLANGNVLLFDNGRHRGWSRVIEVSPQGEIVWEWSGDPPHSLYSRLQGGVESLPNGNVLITESEKGRALEVTRDGAIVWEYLHPEIDEKGRRRSIYRMTRLAQLP